MNIASPLSAPPPASISEPAQSDRAVAAAPLGFWGARLDAPAPVLPWLWDGYSAAGQVTLFTSQWKTGKTTLLANLLARFREGGTLAERTVTPTRPIVVTEEPDGLWRPRHQLLDLRHVYFLCRPFCGKPTMDQWLGLLDQVSQLRQRYGFGFLAIDTVSTLFPAGSELNADCAMRALLPLQKLTADGVAIWLQHHPRKGVCLPGQAARGTGAFAGFADVVLEMHRCPGAADDDRRRRLIACSRSERTPRQLVLELNATATDYRCLGDIAGDEFLANWDRLRIVLEDADRKLTRRDILAQWPADFPRPGDTCLWQWLGRAVALGLIAQQGTGRRNDPFRYWLPAKAEAWQQDPLYELREQGERDAREWLAGMTRREFKREERASQNSR